MVGVAWALLVRYLFLCTLNHHKTHYKLSEGGRGTGSVAGGALANGKVQGGRGRLKVEVQSLGKGCGGVADVSCRSILRNTPIV